MTRLAPPTRRLVLAAVGVALPPRVARAQPVQRRRIAILGQASRAATGENWEAFRQGLRALGYGEEDIAFESRWADGHVERLAPLAAELVRLAPEVIVVGSAAAVLAAKQATATIPIVVTVLNDPVGSGFVGSFAHPGGNVTGLSSQQEDTIAKELELLETVVPTAKRIAVLLDPANPTHAGVLRTLQLAAHIGIVSPLPRSLPDEVVFEDRLRELGYVEGRNLAIDYVQDDDQDRRAAAVGELARRGVDVIKVGGRDAELRAAVSAAPTPVVFTAIESDPQAKGYVDSLAHPGGNLTGVVFQQPELIAKRLDLLTQAIPHIARIVLLYDVSGESQREAATRAASALGISLEAIDLRTPPLITSMPWPGPMGRVATRW